MTEFGAARALWHVHESDNDGTREQATMIASLSARLIAEEWMSESPGALRDGPFELDWFDRLALTRPIMYARLAPKVARMVAAGRAADGHEREAYRRAFAVMRETLASL